MAYRTELSLTRAQAERLVATIQRDYGNTGIVAHSFHGVMPAEETVPAYEYAFVTVSYNGRGLVNLHDVGDYDKLISLARILINTGIRSDEHE